MGFISSESCWNLLLAGTEGRDTALSLSLSKALSTCSARSGIVSNTPIVSLEPNVGYCKLGPVPCGKLRRGVRASAASAMYVMSGKREVNVESLMERWRYSIVRLEEGLSRVSR